MSASLAHTMTAHYAAERARADALVIAMIDATADVWAALTDPHGPDDIRAAMVAYAHAATARQDIDALGYRNNHHVSPSNPTTYRAALDNLRAADRAINYAIAAIGERRHAFIESGLGQAPTTANGCIVCPDCGQPKRAPIHAPIGA